MKKILLFVLVAVMLLFATVTSALAIRRGQDINIRKFCMQAQAWDVSGCIQSFRN